MTREPRLIPVVLRIRGQIDEVFARHVGPIAAELCREEFSRWCKGGDVGPAALSRYIAQLARYISQAKERQAFMMEAAACIRSLDPGKR